LLNFFLGSTAIFESLVELLCSDSLFHSFTSLVSCFLFDSSNIVNVFQFG
jgi:hypothetical protein